MQRFRFPRRRKMLKGLAWMCSAVMTALATPRPRAGDPARGRPAGARGESTKFWRSADLLARADGPEKFARNDRATRGHVTPAP